MRQQGFNGDRTILDIAGDAGVTQLLAVGPVRFVEAIESTLTFAGDANTLQGFEYQLPVKRNPDGTMVFGPWIPVDLPSAEDGDSVNTIMEIGDPQAKRGPFGILLGNGPDTPGAGQPTSPATVLANLRSATATATSVIATQYF